MNKQELLEYFTNENNNFDLIEFLTNSGTDKEYGSIIYITPNQMISTRTLNEGKGLHDETRLLLTRVLYNFSINKEKETEVEKNIIYNQNIMIRIMNETPINFYDMCGNIKSIWIELPEQVTLSQLNFLKELEIQYGSFLNKISIMQEQEIGGLLVGYKTNQEEIIEDHTFRSAIYYVKENLISDNKDIINEDIILENKSKLR